MAKFKKFQDLRIDLAEIIGYDTYKSQKREKGYFDCIYFYLKNSRKDEFRVRYDCQVDEGKMEIDLKILDDILLNNDPDNLLP